MDKILVSLLLVILTVASFIGMLSWYDSEKEVMVNSSNKQIDKTVKDIQDNIK